LEAVKITENVYWVGAIDWGVRNFHGYTTDSGTTYNAFLILDEKITLFDTVKKGFENQLISRISSVIDPEKIDYIISNHSEPDHSGVLPELIDKIKPEKVFASPMGVKALNAHFKNLENVITPVKDGEELSLGKLTVKFMETKMIHWPDSMFSYIPELNLIFTQDAFGMHLATSERFDDLLPWSLLEKQAADYYANIITLYSSHVVKLLNRVEESDFKFKFVAPDHGPVWRDMDNFKKIFSLYKDWSERKLKKKIVIVYDTMWKSTEKMAQYIQEGAGSTGISVKVMPLYASDRSHVASELLEASAVIAGSPTLNNNLFPSVADVLSYVKGLRFKTPYGAVFGSYGWSGEGTKQVSEYLDSMGCEILGEVKSQYFPDDNIYKECIQLDKTVAEKVISNYSAVIIR